MHRIYAQVDEKGIVFAISQLSDEVEHPNLIKLDSIDHSLLGKKYNPETLMFDAVLKTNEELLEEAKAYYVAKIQEAQILNDREEIVRIQEEYTSVKIQLLNENG